MNQPINWTSLLMESGQSLPSAVRFEDNSTLDDRLEVRVP